MEVTNKKAALLCNKEVLTVLQEYSDKQKKNKRTDQNLSTITYEALKYLKNSPVTVQTPESIEEVLKSLIPFSLTKAEKLQLINLRPTTAVEISLLIEECEERVSESQVDEILEIISRLPCPSEEVKNNQHNEDESENR